MQGVHGSPGGAGRSFSCGTCVLVQCVYARVCSAWWGHIPNRGVSRLSPWVGPVCGEL